MSRFLRDLVTGINGSTYDLGRVSWIATFLVLLLAAIGNWYKAGSVPLLELAGSLGANTALHGAAIGLKANTEPKD